MSAASKAAGHGHGKLPALMLGAVGVVYGDIGTSPLYTLKEAFGHQYGLQPDQGNVLGLLSLVFWAMMLVVTLKYVAVVLRADNRGEGGILALMSVVHRSLPIAAPLAYTVGLLGIMGTALFFGDAAITPAMTVLSAVEGLEVVAPNLHPYIVPIAVIVLLVLFGIQRSGTERVGRIFGPVMMVWFVCLGLLGLWQIAQSPGVLHALNPSWAIQFFINHGVAAWLSLGAVVLAVTGGEALYADMGHFGAKPIRWAWLGFVMPMLLLNYFGQGALVLDNPEAVKNPFFLLVPEWGRLGMIVLATAAAVIASQAVISGAFSLARQAMQLGYLPRLDVVHTSDETIGQVFLPWVNRALLVMVITLVLSFGSSTALASAYGVAVTGAMLIDTLLLIVLASAGWGLRGWQILPLAALFIVIDVGLFSANVVKFFDGAWVPFAIGLGVFTLMRTWRRGRALVREQVNRDSIGLDHFVGSLKEGHVLRVPGTAVFLTPSNTYVPPALLHNMKHNKVIHERNVLLSVETLSVPGADADDRVQYIDVGQGFARLTLRYGYMEDPNVPKALTTWRIPGPGFLPMETTYFTSREAVVASPHQGMALWRDKLFLLMNRNATPANESFGIPGNRLVELGTQVVI